MDSHTVVRIFADRYSFRNTAYDSCDRLGEAATLTLRQSRQRLMNDGEQTELNESGI